MQTLFSKSTLFQKSVRNRKLCMEHLEDRCLLSVDSGFSMVSYDAVFGPKTFDQVIEQMTVNIPPVSTLIHKETMPIDVSGFASEIMSTNSLSGTSESSSYVTYVSWDMYKGDANDQNTWGNSLISLSSSPYGYMIYADKNSPDSTNENYCYVSLWLARTGGSETLTCTVDLLDLPNTCVPDGKNGDNNGSFSVVGGSTIHFAVGESLKKITIKLSANAGDNLIVKANSPNNSNYTGATYSSMITVWRRLWVECDTMSYYPETTDTGTIATPPNPASYLGLSTAELARACVKPVLYTPNTHQPPVGHNPLTNPEFLKLFGLRDPGGNDPIEPDPNATPLTSGRDLPTLSTKEFWTVRIVTISAFDTALGAFVNGANSVEISYASIEKQVAFWNSRPQNANQLVSVNDLMSYVILHELCHTLIDRNERNVFISDQGTAKIVTSSGDVMLLDESQYGVRDTIFVWENTINDWTLHLKKCVQHSFLLSQNIKDIQAKSMPRN